ncbi:GNAT family N-acetyltransferase [Tateyamaria sp. SN6-1]|uniref:GNAT family N-acetyltransferase n=1 Tax=Tateyamaria sp. SN6-1 TaxID=3092148 RepID=UPI0039F546F1
MTLAIELTDDPAIIGPILRVLRADLDPAHFESRLAHALQHGYRALVTRDRDACLGFRITHDVHWGKTFFIDDLVVRPHLRGTGIGAALMDHAHKEADAMGCDVLRLCSGLTRTDAHRFYERNGLNRVSLQFSTPRHESPL